MGIHGIAKRNRFKPLVICFLICLASLWASVSTVFVQGGAQQKKNFLWAVKTPKATVYLLGSLHLLKSDAYPLDKSIEAAYRTSKTICFETDIGNIDSPAFQSRMLSLALYPEGQTLEQNISRETYRLLEKKAAAVGLSMAQLNRFKPWFCALTIGGLELKRMGFDPTYGIDRYFFTKAKQDGKDILFLETLEFQMALFSELGSNEGESLLRQALKELEVIETMLHDIVDAWKTGDAAWFEASFTISFKDNPDIYNRLLAQRNKAWVSTIERLIAQGGTAMVVVGAGHLVGPDNLLQLLQNKGYTIQQVGASAELAAENLAHALYIRSGLEQGIRNVPLAIQIGFNQVRNQDDRVQQIPQDVYESIRGLLAEAFAAEHLNAIVLRHMEAQLRQEEMQRILAWLNSPFGKKCSNPFKASLTPTASAELQKFLKNIQNPPPPSNRLALIQELAVVTKAKELTLEIAVNTQVVVIAVITATSPSAPPRPFSAILDEAEKNRPLLEPKVDQQIAPLLLYLYRSLSDAELARYIAFAKSGIGAQYYRSMFNGIKLALMDSSIRFGSTMADVQWERRQAGGTP